jgi:hypothetical protein
MSAEDYPFQTEVQGFFGAIDQQIGATGQTNRMPISDTFRLPAK